MGKTLEVEPVNIGVIGLGQMGSIHARQMAQLDEVRVVAVPDIARERAMAIGKAIGARVFGDAHHLLRKGGPRRSCWPPPTRCMRPSPPMLRGAAC